MRNRRRRIDSALVIVLAVALLATTCWAAGFWDQLPQRFSLVVVTGYTTDDRQDQMMEAARDAVVSRGLAGVRLTRVDGRIVGVRGRAADHSVTRRVVDAAVSAMRPYADRITVEAR